MTNVKTWMLRLAAVAAAASVFAFAGCSGDDGAAGKQGPPGTAPEGGTVQPCSVSEGTDGCATITCPGSSPVKVCGKSGADGGIGSCTIADNPDAGVGCKTISCSDGTTQNVCSGTNPDGGPITPGAGLAVEIGVSAPGNGQYFVAGEQITLTFTLTAKDGTPLTLADLKRANLYMAGPQEPLETKTAVKLLRANTDRSVQPHHYIDLLTSTDSNLSVSGNVVTYKLDPITDEAPGTYRVGLWSEALANPLDQVFALKDVQIGTATVEADIVGNCADCHKGAANGVMYMHHIDPGYSPLGNPSLDSVPVQTCKSCHNNDGYSAVRKCADGSKPTGSGTTWTCADGTAWSGTWLVDQIVRRVHGVHMGEHLLSDFNTNLVYGDFKVPEDYSELDFPFNVKRCTKCHQNDMWKTEPSRLACGACHDNLDFTTGKYTPAKVYTIPYANPPGTATAGKCNTSSICAVGTCNTTSGLCECASNSDCSGVFHGFNGVCNAGKCELQSHGGGAQADDSACAMCHTSGDTGLAPISVVHKVTPRDYPQTLTVSLSAPANGSYYVAGEAPVVTIVYKAKDGTVLDPTTLTEANGWTGNMMFLNGPRARRIPALTSAARAETTSTVAGPWDLSSATDLQLKVGNKSLKVVTTAAVKKAGVTAAEIVAWLNADSAFKSVAFATLPIGSATAVTILAKPSSMRSQLEILTSTVGSAVGFTVGVYTEKAASTAYPRVELFKHNDPAKDDPKLTFSSTDIKYQLDDVATVQAGTYTIYVKVGKAAASPTWVRPDSNWELKNFQVGTATAEPKVATNCTNCHGDVKGADGMHGDYFFDVDLCGSCHDYRRQAADRLATDTFVDGWGINAASGRSNMGFGAAPIARRVHGVHFSHYLNNVKEVHSSWTDAIIFPQDVRNCAKCHADSKSYAEKPARLPCLGCHDSDAAKTHAALMTSDPTPVDAWNGDEIESCPTCHGVGKDFAVDTVHNITNPYVPPYPRE